MCQPMSAHKIVGDLFKPLALLLIILAVQGIYVASTRIPLVFSNLEVSFLNPLCEEIYPVTVRLGGRPLTNLEEANFQVFANNRPVQFNIIRYRTINAMVLLDTSGSMAGPSKIDAEQDMARFVADTVIRSGGKTALITFDSNIRLESDWTNNLEMVNLAISKLQGSGSTRLWDALREAALHLESMRSSRPCELTFIVVISDFEDTASLTSREEALKDLKAVDVLGIAIALGNFPDVSYESAQAVARTTRGRVLRATEAREATAQLQTFFESIYYLHIKEKGHVKVAVSYMERSGSDETDS